MFNALKSFRGDAADVLREGAADYPPASQHPIVHLAIDVQERFSGTLFPERAKDHPKKIHEFRDDLRDLDVPTIHIAYGRGDGNVKHVSRRAVWPMDRPEPEPESTKDIAKLRFLVCPYRDEDVVEKFYDNAFLEPLPDLSDGGLKCALEGYGTQTVIMTGGNTRFCIQQSIEGAIKSGFNVLIAYDRLADQYEPKEELDPLWHKEKVSSTYSVWREYNRQICSPSSLRLATAKECLAFVASKDNRHPARNPSQLSKLPSLG